MGDIGGSSSDVRTPFRRAGAFAVLTKRPALLLCFLAPLLGEIVSGSTPPLVFLLNPAFAALEVALYGGGAVFVRELAVRWRRSWISVIVLGLAYALIEEGLVLKAIFDPNWEGAGLLGSYGRANGIGWVWLLQVSAFHAIVSITIPIMFAGLLVAERRADPWLSSRQLRVLGGAWLLAVMGAAVIVRPVEPPEPQYGLLILVVFALIGLARLWPSRPMASLRENSTRWPIALLIGAIGTWSFFIATWSGPDSGRPPEGTIALQVAILAASGFALRRGVLRGGQLTDGGQLALGTGILSFFLLVGLPTVATGQTFVNLAVMVAMGLLALRLRRRSQHAERSHAAPAGPGSDSP